MSASKCVDSKRCLSPNNTDDSSTSSSISKMFWSCFPSWIGGNEINASEGLSNTSVEMRISEKRNDKHDSHVINHQRDKEMLASNGNHESLKKVMIENQKMSCLEPIKK